MTSQEYLKLSKCPCEYADIKTEKIVLCPAIDTVTNERLFIAKMLCKNCGENNNISIALKSTINGIEDFVGSDFTQLYMERLFLYRELEEQVDLK